MLAALAILLAQIVYPTPAKWGAATVYADAGPYNPPIASVLMDGGATLTSDPMAVGIFTQLYVQCSERFGDPVLQGSLQVQASLDVAHWITWSTGSQAMDAGASGVYAWALFPFGATYARVVETNVGDGGVLTCIYYVKGQ